MAGLVALLVAYLLSAMFALMVTSIHGVLDHVPKGHKRALMYLVGCALWPITGMYLVYKILKGDFSV